MLRVLWREVALVSSIVAGFVALVHALVGELPVVWILASQALLCLHCVVRWTGGAPLDGPLGPRPESDETKAARCAAPPDAKTPKAATVVPHRKPDRNQVEGRPGPQPPVFPDFAVPASMPNTTATPAGGSVLAQARPLAANKSAPQMASAQVDPLVERDDEAAWVPEPIIERPRHDKRRSPKQTWTGL